MARVAGVDLPPNKRAEVGLTYIYGIGRSRSTSILNEASVNLNTRVADLTEDELGRIRAVLEAQGEIEGDLRKRIKITFEEAAAARALRKASEAAAISVLTEPTFFDGSLERAPHGAAPMPKVASRTSPDVGVHLEFSEPV